MRKFAALIVSVGLLDAAAPSGPLVSNERWPRATDLVSWTKDVMRIEGLENATETAQGKAFFRWLRLYCKMAVGGMIQAHEGDYGKEKYVLDAHKNLFVYGWGYCDTCSRIADAAWKEYKQDPAAAQRVVVQNEGAGYHTKYRLRLDGNYGAFDPRYGYYLIDRDSPDARVLDWAEVGDDKNIHANKTYKHRSQPFFEYFGKEWQKTLNLRPVYFESQAAWEKAGSPLESVFGDSHYKIGTKFHDMNFRLPKGMTITRFWDNSARAFYQPVSDRARKEWPFLPSGRFYRVTETMLEGNWPKYDPNYAFAKPYLKTVPKGEGYDPAMDGGNTIGQAWGRMEYTPDLTGALDDVLVPGSTLVPSASGLVPSDAKAGGQAVFELYSPYVLIDGTLETAGAGTTVEIRAQKAKTNTASEPDAWTEWHKVDTGTAELGRPRFNGRDVSIHGVYRFQVRVSVAPNSNGGLRKLGLKLLFENGIMSLPRLLPGKNDLRFELADPTALRGRVVVSYRYQTSAGEESVTQTLRPSDFSGGVARWTVHVPGLVKCNSVTVAYR